ncbi:3'(2'),5'-bisphosphate nucleotidase CysQ [Altericista sp. CCNU0014]|uniref:3'(2'),5'-bisphosphate nucleotidase CysQ family protein n=1 Tax=Altericista sp. CCNU0014 TaxID=3082949 RepID=UPI00384AA218
MMDGLLELARSVGWGAADILRRYYRGEFDLDIQKAHSDPVTAADLAANHYILERLQQELDGEQFGYLSEETFQPGLTPYPQPYVWIIDPLDGTRDFIQKTGEYAIHLALTEAGRPILSVVVWPEQEILYYATKGGGSYAETRSGEVRRLQVKERDRPEDMRLVISRSHRDDRFDALLKRLPQTEQTFVGSVGCKIATILEDRAELYLSLTTKSAPKDWDLAAPELILTEAGGRFTHFDLTPIEYNRTDVAQWGGFLASTGQAHDRLCDSIAQILEELDSATDS